MVTVRPVENNFSTRVTVFEVPLPNREPVFMSIDRTPYNNEKRGVVIVDAEIFLELCRINPNDRYPELTHGTPQTWVNDKKFPEAAKCFAVGRDTPVPLASVSCEQIGEKTIATRKFFFFMKYEYKKQFHYVAFTDGITRTMWLLAHGCKAFPVQCEMPGAKYLHQIAAIPGRAQKPSATFFGENVAWEKYTSS